MNIEIYLKKLLLLLLLHLLLLLSLISYVNILEMFPERAIQNIKVAQSQKGP